jgi:outer membrane protein OmpA-like peptidoglycan-associated protein
MYVNQDRVANVPNANFGRSNKLRFSLNGSTDEPVYVGNFVVAGGGQGLYDALLADGRVATQGIFFDTGSDRIRLESGPTLKTIGDMLKEHADLKLMIEGHTDNVGAAASNKTLSEKRAASVRQYLVTNFGIDAARLASSGFGDTKPAAPNTTVEGRQQNRRVELVKM